MASLYNNRAQIYRLQKRFQNALNDLDLAIKYAPTSDLLGTAYTQRAVLKKELGDVVGSNQDFELGAKYGHPLAKSQISNNPYAKLCNSIVAEAMRRKD
jgi:hypothetical protein